MDTTIPGGKYLAADGVTFVDAWGKTIEVKEAKPDPKSTSKAAEKAEGK